MGANSSKGTATGGLRVHRVYPNGPGELAGIELFFDYILEADGNVYNDDSDDTLRLFTSYIASQENKEVTLTIYNARKKSIRSVTMIPQKWEGVGLLGLTVKFSEFTSMDEGVHVVNVYDGSPASKAGLMPVTDYLLGTNLQLFLDLDCVRIHVANHVDEDVTLMVYNSITETVRKTVIRPTENWGGPGTLGCDLAKGYIHRIPYVKSIWSVPSIDEGVEEPVETIDLSVAPPPEITPLANPALTLTQSTSVEEPYLPPSMVDFQLNQTAEDNEEIPMSPSTQLSKNYQEIDFTECDKSSSSGRSDDDDVKKDTL
ncbi:conserved hypothetical protein [Theileria equi strain WA]|uniref:Uncharacterized protein n=1 Tax=Theileria equi strain WA TaxID=1537102 RepID=L1LC12_THEEQ|nr:conserved hypothetical protein [Theileria equi strain WA]EKX72987.1 conserved hypothetical protein [Theileria equi strain WA]|eukprot:XP_004832439.1 conserved hypothetical protein [Theileria equi strain WA]